MAWKMFKLADCENAVRENQVKLSSLPDGRYLIEYTGKVLSDGEVKLPLFSVLEENGTKIGESFCNVHPSIPIECKNSAVLLSERYAVVVENESYILVPR